MGEIIEITATKDQIRDFIESLLWKDLVRELEAWKEGFQRELDAITDDAESKNPSTAAVLLHIGDINGRKKAVDYFISLPDMLLQILSERTPNKPEEVSNE